MKNRKILGRVGIVFGIISFLMLFVIPFLIIKVTGLNTKLYAGIYFSFFLLSTFIANLTLEKSNKPLSLDEERDEKIRQIIK